ncbi:hypothetical protein [Arthrobacter sp. fls2-241-R2A-200]|uniref:hypothetical protein n=1 Tax=Arthrobacter sp. fls2-241-R2A-200 TaxID=3040281 RepID=UPI002549D8B8|nr:hypothetical protein [Arthrobacter sp. fls2-241-R2A-200]
MGAAVPALLSDLQRPWLWKSSALGVLVVAAFMALLVVASGFEANTPTPGTVTILLDSAFSLTLTGAAVVGSFSFTRDFGAGCIARRVLLFQRGAVFTGRAATATLATGLGGGAIGGGVWLFLSATSKPTGQGMGTVLAFVSIACIGGLWGFSFGSLIRNHLVSLFVVPATLVLPGLLPDSLEQIRPLLFPVESLAWAKQLALHIPASASLLGAVDWLLMMTTAACLVFSKRDLT